MSINIQHFFDQGTSTLTYIVHDPATLDAVVIDPVWDFDPASGKLATKSLESVLNYLREHKLKPHFVLETHAHADHLSSSQLYKKTFPDIKVAINEKITVVQKSFQNIFNMQDLNVEGRDFDLLLKDGQELSAGSLKVKIMATPGHTPACTSFLIEDALFSGDLLFMPDSGCGRCDFPAASALAMYESVTKKVYTLPDQTRIFVGHDYQPQGRELRFQTSVLEQKNNNIQIKSTTSKEEFIEFRTKRDATLSAPKLILPSIQVNIRAGRLPAPESNGISYLKTPLS
jgi:glyoxylase-like metal-dependent hydrolase (beta-lactamase superfamily II)